MEDLIAAVNMYDFPCVLFDFTDNKEITFTSYRKLESYIFHQLHSKNLDTIKDGLSNVLFWGFYRIGFGKTRIKDFRETISVTQLEKFKLCILNNTLSLINIKNMGMPQFSQIAFISKILMFSNPSEFVTLDSKIMKLRNENDIKNPLTRIHYPHYATSISITKNSQIEYLNWCKLCKHIANNNFQDKIAVDIERGFFNLVEAGKIDSAKQIIKGLTVH